MGIGKRVVSESEIQAKVRDLAAELTAAYPGGALLVAVLKGSFLFLADLVRELPPTFEVDFLAVRSYQGTQSSGAVEIVLDLATDITGRDLVLVEDIVDTGLTLDYLHRLLSARGPRSLRIASLFFKPAAHRGEVKPDWVGFEIPPQFVVGYGMDVNERYRGLRDVVEYQDE
ncbi:MAG: hypoxanthine-guanine phosphoribosyltransferase [Fimbriimonadales bacterium]|nr:MAG: hypoxanthine-guanine phosphoribosyltransferase [Fimbriimonadales bacterium]